jgi:hypothetical protein
LCVFIIEFLLSCVLFRLCLIPRTSSASVASCFQAPPQTLVSWQNFFKTVWDGCCCCCCCCCLFVCFLNKSAANRLCMYYYYYYYYYY